MEPYNCRSARTEAKTEESNRTLTQRKKSYKSLLEMWSKNFTHNGIVLKAD
jgi:hypothetical protein